MTLILCVDDRGGLSFNGTAAEPGPGGSGRTC